MWVLREIVLGYKRVGGGEWEGRYVNVSGTASYGVFEILDKIDGIADEMSEFTIFVLAILVPILCKKKNTHFDLLL